MYKLLTFACRFGRLRARDRRMVSDRRTVLEVILPTKSDR
jgi:hypothetical protein